VYVEGMAKTIADCRFGSGKCFVTVSGAGWTGGLAVPKRQSDCLLAHASTLRRVAPDWFAVAEWAVPLYNEQRKGTVE